MAKHRRARSAPTESEHRFHYTYEGGNEIRRDGAPFVTIVREGRTMPYTVNEVANELAAHLNRKRWRGTYDR